MKVPALACRALRIKPTGSPATTAGTCAFCGHPYVPGDLVAVFKPGSSFNDRRSLLPSPGKVVICGECAALSGKKVIAKYTRFLVTEDAAYALHAAPNRAWFILHPPTKPFAVALTSATSAHLFWRVPATLDPDFWTILLNGRLLTMHRPTVLHAYERVQNLMADWRAAKNTKSKQASPFADNDPLLGNLAVGVLQRHIRTFAYENGRADDVRFLERITSGELWGLQSLIFGAAKAVAPQPIPRKVAA